MLRIVQEDTKVLIPNLEHKNFTESDIVLTAGTPLEGKVVNVKGKRRGEDFIYKLFLTNNNQYIYLNKLNKMNTEVTLGADAAQTETKINFIPAEATSRNKFMATVLGGVAGFAYAKYKKHDMRKAAMYIGIGAVAGYVAGIVLDKKQQVIVKK